MAIALTGSQSYSLLQRRTDQSSAATDPRAGARAAGAATTAATATAKTVSVELSDQAKAALAGGPPVAIGFPKSLDEIIQKRTDALASKLTDAFTHAGIPLDDAILLKFDAAGKVATDSPYKKKIEDYFEADPEAAKELKAISSLNALKAAEEALKIFVEEKRAAKTDEQKEAAFGRHVSLSLTIQKLSGVLTFKDGTITSAARDYVEALKPSDASSDDPASSGVAAYL